MRSTIRSLGILGVLGGTLIFGAAGCGGGVEEGVPEGIDMTKDYTPQVDMPGMSPKMQRSSAKGGQANPSGGAAPAPTP